MSSYSLKKALDKEIKKKYNGTGVFCNYTKTGDKFQIRKARGFKQSQFMKGFAKSDDTKLIACLGFSTNEERESQEKE